MNRQSAFSIHKFSFNLTRFVLCFGIAVLFNFLLLVSSANAQNTVTGAFQGDVGSRTGEVITTAIVVITNEQTGTIYNLTTDSKGRFYQGLLAPGFYTIRVTAAGYRTQLLRREIKVSLTGDVVPVPVRLEPEPPPVAGATPVPPPTTAEEANNIRIEEISGVQRARIKKSVEIAVRIGAALFRYGVDLRAEISAELRGRE